jgi:hypothetical protein
MAEKVVIPRQVPLDSAVHAVHVQADYWDAYEVVTAGAYPTALHAYLAFMARTPRWIEALMAVRNAAVRLIGLKDVGKPGDLPPLSSAGTLRPGDRAGIFTIRSICDREVVFEIRDSHLDVLLSVYQGAPGRVTVSTLVFIHNWIGRLYMLPVTPMHRIVVRSTLSRGARLACSG